MLVVLLTMLLLAGILAATLRLSLGSRQNTADQKATLQAQYTAESGITFIRSRLRDTQTVLSAMSPDGSKRYMQFSIAVPETMMDDWARLFCGQSSGVIVWSQDTANTLGNSTKKCDFSSSTSGNQKFSILANMLTNDAYSVLPASEKGSVTSASVTQRTAWWENYLNDYSSNGNKYKVRPVKVLKSGYTYRFYLAAYDINTSAEISNSRREIDATKSTQGLWWFQVSIPNPFDNALMLNRWNTEDGGFYDDVIKGNIFTNQNIKFLFNKNKSRFMGDIISAGCAGTAFPADNAPFGTDCSSKSAGFYGDINTFKGPNSGVTADEKNLSIKNQIKLQGATVDDKRPDPQDNNATLDNKIDFYHAYVPLPLTVNTQAQAAAAGGIVVDSALDSVEMFAGYEDGSKLSNYDSGKSAWKEESKTYQYITLKSYKVRQVDANTYNAALSTERPAAKKPYFTPQNCSRNCSYFIYDVDRAQEYRADEAGNLFLKNNSGWGNLVKSNFNGVIYSNHEVSVSGPRRTGNSTSSDVTKMPPALASFSKINLTVTGGMDLETDLTMSNTPCGFDNKWPTGVAQPACPKKDGALPKNSLALYTPDKDITMTTETKNEATYHAAILASKGTFNVQNYSSRPVQGQRHVVGAVVEDKYGLNGTASINRAGDVVYGSGYGDDFSQDVRFKDLSTIPTNPIAITVWEFTDAKAESDSTAVGMNDFIWKQGD